MRCYEIRNAHRRVVPRPCGEGCATLIIASIGTSSAGDPLTDEYDKALAAQRVGAGAVTDHSFHGAIADFHQRLAEELTTLVSTVGCYELGALYPGHDFRHVSPEAPVEIIEAQARRGMDIITVHAALKRDHLPLLAQCRRLIPMTSKGGAIVSAFMRSRDEENPYYSGFERVLETCARHHVTLSLGTSLRPASVCDGWDELLQLELETMGDLVARALDYGVQVMVEGIGHAAIDAIGAHVSRAKVLCHGVPYRVLPMCTDVALGFDHISGAIAGAVAVAAGADAITCMSRAEHIGLPTLQDLEEAVIASRIAAHAGELVKLRDFHRDRQMSVTRWQAGCKGDWTSAVYPDGAREALETRGRLHDQMLQCAMCGAHCGIAGALASRRASAPGPG